MNSPKTCEPSVYQCIKTGCWWSGFREELNVIFCPKCGASTLRFNTQAQADNWVENRKNERKTLEETEIDQLKRQLAEAQAACAVKNKALDSAWAAVWDGHYSGKGATVEYARQVDKEIQYAKASTCGQGWKSPEEHERLRKALELLNNTAFDITQQQVYDVTQEALKEQKP